MGSASISLFIRSRLSVKNFCRVNSAPVLQGKIKHFLLDTGETSTPIIVFEHLFNVFDFVGRYICLL